MHGLRNLRRSMSGQGIDSSGKRARSEYGPVLRLRDLLHGLSRRGRSFGGATGNDTSYQEKVAGATANLVYTLYREYEYQQH